MADVTARRDAELSAEVNWTRAPAALVGARTLGLTRTNATSTIGWPRSPGQPARLGPGVPARRRSTRAHAPAGARAGSSDPGILLPDSSRRGQGHPQPVINPSPHTERRPHGVLRHLTTRRSTPCPHSRGRELWPRLPLPAMRQRQENLFQEGMREHAHLLDSNEI